MASDFHLEMSGLGFFKKCAETSNMLEVLLANFAQLWDPPRWIRHPKLPLLRPQKHQNPSNGSKVVPIWRIWRQIKNIVQIGKILKIGITFEPFDGFWCFWGLSRSNLGCWIYLWGSQSCATFGSIISSILLVSAQFLKYWSEETFSRPYFHEIFVRIVSVACITW